jgi:hypothetical protein
MTDEGLGSVINTDDTVVDGITCRAGSLQRKNLELIFVSIVG